MRDEADINSKVLSCRRLGNDNIAELQLQGDGLQVAAATHLIVRAPDVQNDLAKNVWLLQAMTEGVESGWGQSPGFNVIQMEQARLIYGGAPSFKTKMAVVFRTSQKLFGGGRVDVLAPEVYKLSCRVSEGFRELSLVGVQVCDDAGTGRLSLTLNQTLAPGDYSFMFGATNPAYTPAVNAFSVLLKDAGGNVVDARMHFAGHRIIQGLYVRPPELKFTSSTPLSIAQVQIDFQVSSALDPYDAIGGIRALQIGVPDRFELITTKDLQNLDGLITPELGWFHFYQQERLIRIDIVAAGGDEKPILIPPGEYRFVFQVKLPEFWMPNVNVWLLSLCRDRRCTDLIATLPAAGFYFGDEPNLEPIIDWGGSSDGQDKQADSGTGRSAQLLFFLSALLPMVVLRALL